MHSGTERRLASSAYGERRASAEAAAALLGPLRDAGADAIEALDDPILVRRARHVHGECRRVERFVQALESGDLRGAGSEMLASHRSLRDDYEVSTPALDALVETLAATAGVFGARMTGAGFGGCVVALTSASFDLAALGGGMRGWSVRAVDGIHLDRG